jgi:hypothetical protein|tara:strand:+ start:764 stop:1069 length:306 start_codon:yes stop_codon:yes gene_type:complete
VLKVAEVFEKQVKKRHERPDGTEYVNFTTVLEARDGLLNKDYIVGIRPHCFTSDRDTDRVKNSFPANTKFSTIVLDGNSFQKSEIIVVGSFEKFCQELQET